MLKTYKQMIQSLTQRFYIWQWCVAALILWIISNQTMGWLNGLYAQSQFPVPFFIGQTTFNAVELKGYFAVLIELDTLDKFITVQLADYLYMLTVLVSQFTMMVAMYRILPDIKWMKQLGWFMVLMSPAAASFDALENLVSFVMLANPKSFYDGLVFPYSSFAVLKFSAYAAVYLWCIFAILATLIMNGYQGIHSLFSKKI